MSFLEGIDLSDAGKRAMTADLELRRNDNRNADRFYRYPYQGGADLCLQHGEFRWGRVLPEEFERYQGEIGQCYGTALKACQADERLVYVEGYCTSGAGFAISHGWCLNTEDDNVIDLVLPCSADQISRRYKSSYTGMPFPHPTKWAYYGVRFTTELVSAHHSALGLPMLDRSRHESYASGDDWRYQESHDWPILQVPYNSNRTEMPPWHRPKQRSTSSKDTGDTFQMENEFGSSLESEDPEDDL